MLEYELHVRALPRGALCYQVPALRSCILVTVPVPDILNSYLNYP